MGTPEWMAPELLERTLPVAWFEPDRSGACPVDKTVPGLREAAASWRPDSAAEGSTPMQTRWAVEDLCRGDIYGLGVVLWEMTAPVGVTVEAAWAKAAFGPSSPWDEPRLQWQAKTTLVT